MQQHLPFTVLKQVREVKFTDAWYIVATAPTVYGIETRKRRNMKILSNEKVATAPTVYGIETFA